MPERSIELITGPYRSGKSIWLLEQVAEHCRKSLLSGKQAIITVPSHRYKRLVEERLVEMVVGRVDNRAAGLVGLKILPFYDLCHQVLRQAGCGFRLIPDSIRPAILVKAIEKVKLAGRLTGLSSIADFAGTHAHMLELIDELERAGFSPSEVISQLSKMAASDARYMELGRVYEAYWQELESLNVFDERKLAYKTREILNNLDPDVLSIGLLAVDGFDRFNRLQLQVLSSIAKQSERTIIAFDYVAAPNFAHTNYSWKDKSLSELKEAFAPILREIVRNSSDAVEPRRISFRALDRLMEMEEVAREAKKCLAEGYKADQIVVVARSVKPYMTAIRAAFERAQIDYFLDEPLELGSLPLVKYLRRLLHLPVSDFARQDVVRTLSSPFFNRGYLDITLGEIEEIDDQSLSTLTVKGASDWHWALKLSKLIERLLLPGLQASGYEKTLTEHVSFVEDLIDDLLILPNDEEFSNPLVSWEEHQALFEFRRVLANLVLEETLLADAYGPQLCTYSAFFKRLERALENANFRRPKVSAEAITVCSADLVPNRRFKVIIVAGLNEGEFPRRSEQGGFLSKDEVRKWMSYGIDIENPRHHQSFEPSLYDSLVERATDKLCQSSPIYEMTGEELIPSFFLTKGDEAAAAALAFRAPRTYAMLEPTSAQELAAGWLWLSGRQAMRNLELPASSWIPFDVRQFLTKLELPFSTVQARTQVASSNVFNEFNGCLNEQVSLNLISVKTPEMWSVSRLNDYGKCPFRFWVSHTLKIEKMEEPELGLDSRLLGEVYHKALEVFYLELKERGLSILDSNDGLLHELFESSITAAIAWLEKTRKFRHTDFWQYEQKEIAFRLRRFFVKEKERAVRSGGEFVPTYFEKGFGFKDGESSPALVLQVDGQTVKMHGRVDRIDVSSDGRVKVIDYKSSSGAISKKEALAGRNMQLPVYAMAVSDAIFADRNVQIKNGTFLSFSSGDQIGTIDFQDGENDYIGLTKDHIGNYVSNIKKGNFSVRPTSPDSCKHCDHQQICRITELGASDDSD
ncbi:MAG: PD-(D/E)XK nuclease family protein [Candidatus Obscuribacterales bacterium]|jgi:ATP-dependent helicase/DNAse subunit B